MDHLRTKTATTSEWHHVPERNSSIIFPKLLSDFLSRCGMHSYHIMRPFPTTPQFDTVCSCRKNALKEIPHRQVLWSSSSGSISTISTASAYDVSALSVSLHLDVTEKNVTSLVFANFLTKGEHWLTMHLHTCPLRIITTCSLLPCIAITHTPTHPPTHPPIHL